MLIGMYIPNVSFNGSRVEIKRHAAYAGNCFADLSALELLGVECDLLDKFSYDNIVGDPRRPRSVSTWFVHFPFCLGVLTTAEVDHELELRR